MIDSYILKNWLSKSTSTLGLGSTNVKYVDVHRGPVYLSKYFSEKEHELFLPSGVYHYTTSRDIRLNDFYSEDDWIYIQMPYSYICDKYGNIIRNIIGEIECVYSHVEWVY